MDSGRAFPDILRAGPPEPEAKIRFQFYSLFAALALPNMVAFGTIALLQNNYLLLGLMLASGAGLVGGWLRLRSGHDDRRVYRANGLVYGLLVIYMLARGGEGGSQSLWIFTYPLVVAFLFGEREAFWWGTAILLCAVALFWLPRLSAEVFPYPPGFKTRLVLIYVVVTTVTLGFEYSRRYYHDGMLVQKQKLEAEKHLLRRQILERERAEEQKAVLIQELQDALAQVRTLKGLLPICAHCHRIRDGQGLWNPLEAYMREHAGARFSHGICPSCMTDHYPDSV